MKTPNLSIAMIAVLSMLCIGGISSAAKEVKGAATEDEGIELSMVSDIVVAKVIWVKGSMNGVSPDGKTRALQKDSPVYLHDTLVTDGKSHAQIVFTDDSLMTFRPSSKFYIEHYEYKPKESKSAGRYFMNLIEGGFRTVTGLIAKGDPDSYQVNTPVATIGVRGTEYNVALVNGELFVGYEKGTPCVSNKSGTTCLDDKNRYVNVPNADSAPVPVSQRPAALGDEVSMTPASFSSGGGSDGTTGGSTLFDQGGEMPVGSGGSTFCIQ